MVETRTGGKCPAGRHVITNDLVQNGEGAACTVDSCSEWCDCLNKHGTFTSTHLHVVYSRSYAEDVTSVTYGASQGPHSFNLVFVCLFVSRLALSVSDGKKA